MRHEHLGPILFILYDCIKTFVHELFWSDIFKSFFGGNIATSLPSNMFAVVWLPFVPLVSIQTPGDEVLIYNYKQLL